MKPNITIQYMLMKKLGTGKKEDMVGITRWWRWQRDPLELLDVFLDVFL